MTKSYLKDYPRPQLVRDNWQNLNGVWDFAFDDEKVGEEKGWYSQFPKEKEIRVPFSYETKLSGIQDESRHDVVWYHKTIVLDGKQLAEKKTILHFEGTDYYTKVWVNGKMVGTHTGGYSRFSLDITEAVKVGENSIVAKVEDSFDMQQPRGKQRWKNENYGCWYVQTTGIWKTVWMEQVPFVYLKGIKMTPVFSEGMLQVEYEMNAASFDQDIMVEAVVTFEEEFINKVAVAAPMERIKTTIPVYAQDGYDWSIRSWSPAEPHLYDIVFRVTCNGQVVDEVKSYFGMREIRIDNGVILLNGVPLYQRLILDQGYWEDSHLTPPSEEALMEDIDKIKELGYNGLRKHQKVEDERFLYWCDVKGMLVWSEAPAAYQFSDKAIELFTREWMEIVRQNYNHPAIITWTPFNESWGIPNVEVNKEQQYFTESIYYLTKAFDKERPVTVNDGWEHTISDIITLHDYEANGEIFYNRYYNHMEEILETSMYHSNHKSAFANGYEYNGQPILISEFGGIAFNNDDSGWGYGEKVANKEEFVKRFDGITTAIKEIPHICGFCYTQVTDVQQEINGLMYIDRSFKIDPEIIKEINERPLGYWHSANQYDKNQ